MHDENKKSPFNKGAGTACGDWGFFMFFLEPSVRPKGLPPPLLKEVFVWLKFLQILQKIF